VRIATNDSDFLPYPLATVKNFSANIEDRGLIEPFLFITFG
jgi:hypothetical protein